jgi:signal transduction histidine kinase
LCLPLVFENSRRQGVAFLAIVATTGMLCWIDVGHPELVQPFYETPLDRRLDVLISRMLALICCGMLLLRGKRLYTSVIERLHTTEIERLRLVEQQVRAAERRRTRELEIIRSMSRGFAHDLSNLLTVVSNNAEILEEELTIGALDLAQTREDLIAIRTSAHAAVRLTRRLLDSRDSTGDTLDRFELSEFLAEQALLVSRLAPGVDVQLESVPRAALFSGRREVLEQVILNLCLNAVQAMQSEGRIVIRCVVAETEAWIDVVDDGPGIPHHILPRIFEPRFTTRREAGGTGLGLSMVREGIESHGGSIQVDSTPGEGTCFRVRLPGVQVSKAAVA